MPYKKLWNLINFKQLDRYKDHTAFISKAGHNVLQHTVDKYKVY